jgi:integral membrane sensor domain MASE1
VLIARLASIKYISKTKLIVSNVLKPICIAFNVKELGIAHFAMKITSLPVEYVEFAVILFRAAKLVKWGRFV